MLQGRILRMLVEPTLGPVIGEQITALGDVRSPFVQPISVIISHARFVVPAACTELVQPIFDDYRELKVLAACRT
jgi:hypothetical protein